MATFFVLGLCVVFLGIPLNSLALLPIGFAIILFGGVLANWLFPDRSIKDEQADPVALAKEVADRAAAYTETKRNYDAAVACVQDYQRKHEALRTAAYAVLEEEGLLDMSCGREAPNNLRREMGLKERDYGNL